MSDQLPIITEDELAQSPDDIGDTKLSDEPPPYSPNYSLESNLPNQNSVESADLPELRVYIRRWYILGLFCFLACLQCLVWNTWGPIESGARFAFGWSASTVPMFANWGTIMFVLTVIPLCKMVEIDVRRTILLVSGFTALGAVLRCCRLFTDNSMVFLISCHICSILNGVSGVTVMSAPPLISAIWFPTSERTTATAINQASNALGNGIAMLLGPALVHYRPDTNTTDSISSNYVTHYLDHVSNSTQTKEEVRANIDVYMWIMAGLAVALFGLFLIYFPSKPPHPPAPSSAIERTEFLKGIKAMVTNRDVLLACFAYSISQGVMGVWQSVMAYQIEPLEYNGVKYNEQQIGMMGLVAVLSGCVMSMVFGYIMDHLKHKMKITILILLLASTGGFVWLMLMCLPSSGVSNTPYFLYIAIIIANSASSATQPLFFEMTVELAYPVNEGTVAGFLTSMNNMVGMTFLLLFFVPALQQGNMMWMSYALVGSTMLAIPATACIKEHYNRSNVDEVAMDHTL